jgi:hypothetical protein
MKKSSSVLFLTLAIVSTSSNVFAAAADDAEKIALRQMVKDLASHTDDCGGCSPQVNCGECIAQITQCTEVECDGSTSTFTSSCN